MNNLSHTLHRAAAVGMALGICLGIGAQLQAEYFFDADPGFGHATTVTNGFADDGTLQFQPSVANLPSGSHIIGIRAYGSQGWGPTIVQQFIIPKQWDTPQISFAEYFFDEDPGFGKGTSLPVTPGTELSLDNVQIPVNNLPVGSHTIGIRTYGSHGWGPTIVQQFTIPKQKDAAQITSAEYFFDDDPGFGKGLSLPITPCAVLDLDNMQLSVADLPSGSHTIGIRAYGLQGWGPTIVQPFTVPRVQGEMVIERIEYFWDDDPGFGQATAIALTPATELRMDDIELPADHDAGEHLLFVRAYGGNGWGPTINCTVEELIDIAEADLAALRKFHNDFDGTKWNGKQWDTATGKTASASWSGVDFDGEGHVTAIELPDRNISGTLSTSTALALSHLTSLDLSGNQLVGDVSTLANVERLPLLTTLDLSYNQIDELSSLLPTTIITLNLSNQHRTRNNKKVFPGIDNLTVADLDVSNEMTVVLPSLWSYNHTRQSLDAHSQLTVYDGNLNSKATLKWSPALGAYTFSPSSWQLKEAQDAEVIIIPTTSSGENYTNGYNSAYRAQLHFTEGDANLSGWTDVNDVQRTLNYVLNSNNTTAFGLWAANTYDDDDYDATNETINIQDIVCTVNIVLDNEGNPRTVQRRLRRADSTAPNRLYADGHTLTLDANDEVAAFCLHLRGAKSNQVKLLLNSREWQMQTRDIADGVSLLVFSPTGNTLPTGITPLLRTTVDAEPVSIQATDSHAEELAVSLRGGSVTGIETVAPESQPGESTIYDLQGRRLGNGSLQKGIYIINGQKIRR